MNGMLFQYVRNRKRQRVGVMVAVIQDADHFKVGYSLCKVKSEKNPTDVDTFNPDTGMIMATNRATDNDRSPYISEVPQSMKADYIRFVNRASRYFKRLPV